MRLSVLFALRLAKRAWRKRNSLCLAGLLTGWFVSGPSTLHANEKVASLCALQDKAAEGDHITAQVAGVCFFGLDMGPLRMQPVPRTLHELNWPCGLNSTRRNCADRKSV